jgi:hypothetical protein
MAIQIPELLTVREVADILKISPDSVTRRFQNYPGVVDVGQPETRFGKRYRVLRIPRNVLERYLVESRVARRAPDHRRTSRCTSPARMFLHHSGFRYRSARPALLWSLVGSESSGKLPRA